MLRRLLPLLALLVLLPAAADAAGPAYGKVRLLDPHPRVADPAVFVPFYIADAAFVVLDVLDPDGEPVARLAEGAFAAGRHAVRWRGEDAAGRRLAPGLYTLRLHVGESVRTVALPLVG